MGASAFLTIFGLVVTMTFVLLTSFCLKLQDHINTSKSIQNALL